LTLPRNDASSALGGLHEKAGSTHQRQPITFQRRFHFEATKAWANVPQEYRVDAGILKAAKRNRLDILKDLVVSQNETVKIDYRHPGTGETAWDIAVRTDNSKMQDILGLPKKYDTATGAFDAIEAGDRAALRLWLAKGYDPRGSHPSQKDLTPFKMASSIGRDMMACDLAAASGRSLDEDFYKQHRAWEVNPTAPWTYGIFKNRFGRKPAPELLSTRADQTQNAQADDLPSKYVFVYRSRGGMITRDFNPKTGLMVNGKSVFELMETLDKRRNQPTRSS
jgi:hypothetical protein